MELSEIDNYILILKDELIPAMGCTEPISLAYAGSLGRKYLGEEPNKIDIVVSGNIIKNVKSVVVPNTGGMKGIIPAVASGIVAGDSDLVLEVLSKITKEDIKRISTFISEKKFSIEESKSGLSFYIQLSLYSENHSSQVRIVGKHTNVVLIKKDDKVILDKDFSSSLKENKKERSCLTIKKIVEFADTVKLEDVEKTIQRQIDFNSAIAEEGLKKHYGADIGNVILSSCGNSVTEKAKAYAAAASDARMSGCDLPVIINSGSGNQGITCSLPVVIYAKELGISHEKLIRALVVSNLVTIHIKTGIGRLSAYCGATAAGVGAGSGITYLLGGKEKEISHTIVNSLAIESGMICDGAKASCAAKIASAIEAGILGMEMYKRGKEFYNGDGIVSKGVENTINNVGKLASKGMKQTDDEIIDIMIHG